MSKTKKIAILAIIAMVLTMMPASLFAVDFDGDRIQGADRYATALAIAEAGWDTADAVVLAAGENNHLVDALAAAPLAGQENAPILLTPKAALKAEVKAAIEDLGAKTVYVVGAVSDAVVAEVEALGVDVEKLSGADRWATADAINAELDAPAGTFVVGYNAVADAMSAASYAAANGFKIVLAKADGSVDADALVGDVYIVGGEKWVKDIDGAVRLAGADRFATNAEVAEGLEYDFGVVYVANGLSLVDALAVAPLAAMDDAFVLLCSANDVEVLDSFTAATQFIAVGGTSAVPNKILDKLAGEESDELAVVDVEALNLVQVAVTFNKDVTGNKDVEKASNYTIEDTKGKVLKNASNPSKYVKVKDVKVNGKVAVLTLGEEAAGGNIVIAPVENQKDAVVVIGKSVVGQKLSFDVEFSDFEIPETLDAEVIGKNDIKVTFSEPMAAGDDDRARFEVESADGKTSYRVTGVEWAKTNTEATVKISKDLEDGDKIVLKVDGKLKDYAGFSASKKTFELTVKEDNRDIEVVSYRNASEDGVVLILNKNVKLANGDTDYVLEEDVAGEGIEGFYHTNSKNPASKAEIDGNELTLSFNEDYAMPTGTVYVFIDGEELEDFWGNENNSLRVKIDVEADTVAPEIDDITVVNSRTLLVEFDQKLDEKSAEKKANYAILDADKKEIDVKVDRATLENDTDVRLRLDGELDPGTYYLEVDGVEDKNGNATDSLLEEFKVEGNAISLSNVDVSLYVDRNTPADDVYTGEYTEYTFVIDYDRKMETGEGRYAVDNPDNYAIEIDTKFGTKLFSLPELDDEDDFDVEEIYVSSDSKVVEFTVVVDADADNDKHKAINNLTIFRVADSTGTLSEEPVKEWTSPSLTAITPDARVGQLKIKKVTAVGEKTIEVEFDKKIDSLNSKDFRVEEDGKNVDYISSVKLGSNDKIVTITLKEKVKADATLNNDAKQATGKLELVVVSNKTCTEKDEVLKLDDLDGDGNDDNGVMPVEDGINPKFDDEGGADEKGFEVTTGDLTVSIKLFFTENVAGDPVEFGNSFEVKLGKDRLIYGPEFSILVDNDNDTITLVISKAPTAIDDDISINYSLNYAFTDDTGNPVQPFSLTVYDEDVKDLLP